MRQHIIENVINEADEIAARLVNLVGQLNHKADDAPSKLALHNAENALLAIKAVPDALLEKEKPTPVPLPSKAGKKAKPDPA